MEYKLSSKQNIWKAYSSLHGEVYEPLKNTNIDSVAEKFSHFLLFDSVTFEEKLWFLYPKAWKAKYKHLQYTNRLKDIHPRLLTELADWKLFKTSDEVHALEFDEKNSLLKVDALEVPINKQNRDNNAHLLLKHVFSQPDISIEFFYEDMAEAFFGEDSRYNNNPDPYRFACDQVNKALYAELRKSGNLKKVSFFLYNNKKKGSCRINPVYLS